MKNNETGEYELVVGNPQLLSAFVIVVLLCAAAFVMGYEVGQNTPRSAKAQAGTAAAVSTPPAANTQSPAPPVSTPAESNPSQPAETNPTQPPADDAAKPTEAPPQPTTQPAREFPAAPAPAPPVHQESAAPPATAAAPAGSYCQAMAVKQASDAQSLLQTLKDGGMPASLQTSADGLVRVMVGPYQDRAALSRAKTELETRFQIRGPICRQ
jgi:cell division septation protein DedD